MNILQKDLLDDLIARTEQITTTVQSFRKEPVEKLNWKPSAEKWSVLECLEHLNRYYAFYIPELERRINQSNTKPAEIFKSGYLGETFAKSMLPDESGKIKKMNTFKSKNPVNSVLDMRTVDGFLNKQEKLLDLLERSYHTNLNRVRTNITIARGILKLKLGDTLRFVIYHNQRHINQALNVLEEVRRAGDNQ